LKKNKKKEGFLKISIDCRSGKEQVRGLYFSNSNLGKSLDQIHTE
jgi:hypothetical protein